MGKPEELATRPAGYEDFFAPAESSQAAPEDAGKGSEDVNQSDIVLPRVKLIQSLSPEAADLEIAGPGQLWLTPHNRPMSFKPPKKGEPKPEEPVTMRFIPVRIYPAWRRWTPKDEGGGLECEASAGDLVARDKEGLTGAKLKLAIEGDSVTALEWEGGTPTDSCMQCVFGPHAGTAAAGKPPSKRANSWLPKLVDDGDGNRVRVPDELRKPRCTQSVDVLGYIAIPPFEGQPGEITPAFITFSRTSMKAGNTLQSMVKLQSGQPAWAGMYELGTKKVTGEFTYFVMTAKKLGWTPVHLMDACKELYEASRQEDYRPDMTDGAEAGGSSDTSTSAAPPKDDDEQAPDDDF